MQAAGIPVVHDAPGVGENLQDHLEFYFQVASKEPVTLFSSTGLLPAAMVGLHGSCTADGLGATNHFEAGGFIRSRPGSSIPTSSSISCRSPSPMTAAGSRSEHGYQAHVGPMRSKSRGSVRLAGPTRGRSRVIRFNYMSHADDWTEMRAAVRLTREIFAQPAFDRYRGREIQPGAEVTSDEAIDAFIRAKGGERLSPLLHLQDGPPRRSACRGGPGGAGDRRRAAPGRRCLDHAVDHHRQPQRADHHDRREGGRHVLGRPPLPPSNAPYYVAPDWETAQR